MESQQTPAGARRTRGTATAATTRKRLALDEEGAPAAAAPFGGEVTAEDDLALAAATALPDAPPSTLRRGKRSTASTSAVGEAAPGTVGRTGRAGGRAGGRARKQLALESVTDNAEGETEQEVSERPSQRVSGTTTSR
jgi:hypothetical protein